MRFEPLTAPGGYAMSYDAAGNLTNDTYTGQGARTYDAENRMTTAWANGQWQSYSYDADGHRARRKVNNVEAWQVYGIGGELIAEYAANAAPASPQKEYGYRNGELLLTATVTTGSGGSAFAFTDDPVVAETTTVRAVHVTELRAAVNQARARANLSSATWTDDPVQATVTAIKAVHITELRARLDEARAALGLSAANYTDPTLISGYQIKAAHVQELRTKTNEVLTTGAGTSLDLRWLVTDHLGTPRMIFDQSGSLANVSRHDYLPFGEELFAGTGGRTPQQGYAGDSIRQKFTSKERDNETGLDYSINRYYSPTQGRFTSVDPLSGEPRRPQSWNRYSYVLNNPLKFIDPDGLRWLQRRAEDGTIRYGWCATEECYNNAIDTKSKNYAGWMAVTFDETESFTFRIAGGGGDRYDYYQLNPDGTHGCTTCGAMSTDWNAQFAIGGLLRGAMSGLGRAAAGLLSRQATTTGGEVLTGLYGKVTAEALESAAASGGPTVQVFTRLTQAPAVGKSLSVAFDEGGAPGGSKRWATLQGGNPACSHRSTKEIRTCI